jgi:hypothetical protein
MPCNIAHNFVHVRLLSPFALIKFGTIIAYLMENGPEFYRRKHKIKVLICW